MEADSCAKLKEYHVGECHSLSRADGYWLREAAIKLLLWSNACTDHSSLPFSLARETLVDPMRPLRAFSVLCGWPFTKISTREIRFVLSRGPTFEEAAIRKALFMG